MQKKIFFLLSIVISLIFVVFGYLQLTKSEENKNLNAFPIPQEAIEVLLRLNSSLFDTDATESDSPMWKQLFTTEELQEFAPHSPWMSVIHKKYASNSFVHLQGNTQQTTWTYIAQAKSSQTQEQLLQEMLKTFHPTDTLEYDYGVIWKFQKDKQSLFVHIGTQLCLFSPKRIAIEEHLRLASQHKQEKLSGALLQLWNSADKQAPCNAVINYKRAKPLLSIFAEQIWGESLTKNMEWGVLDIRLSKASVSISGLNSSLDISTNAATIEFINPDFLPQSTIYFEQYSIAQAKQNMLQRFEGEELERVQSFWKGIWGKEFTRAELFSPRSSTKKSMVVVLSNSATEDVRERLFQLSKDKELPEEKKSISVGQQNYPAFGVPSYLCVPVMGVELEHCYLVIREDEILVGELPAIQNLLLAQQKDHALADDKRYGDLSGDWSQSASYRFFLQPKYASIWGAKKIVSNSQKRLLQHEKAWRNFSGLSLEVENKAKFIYTAFQLTYAPPTNQRAQAKWACQLEAPLVGKPTFVRNHYTGNKEVFVQDANNQVYLINEKAEILWKLQLTERIKGDVHQIDYYNNGKFQLVFNTTNQVHGVDRLGRNLEGYPFNLPFPATNGMAVVDYDGKSNYRYFVACINKEVFAFTKEGSVVEGWNAPKTNSEVQQAIQYFKVDGKDYLLLSDKENVYILNRRGKERVKLKQQFGMAQNNQFWLEMNPAQKRPYWLTTTSSGAIKKIYTDGTVHERQTDIYSENHHFLYKDFDGDALPDYIFLDNKTLQVYNQLFDDLYGRKFEKEVFHTPAYFNFGLKNKKIGIYAQQEALYYLIGKQGKLEKGFPVQANSPMSISKMVAGSTGFDAVVGRGNFLYLYRLYND